MNLIEVRNGNPAGPAPGSPKLNQVSLSFLEFLDRRALHPFPILQRRRRVSDFESCFCGDRNRRARCQSQQRGPSYLLCFHVHSSTGLFFSRAVVDPPAATRAGFSADPLGSFDCLNHSFSFDAPYGAGTQAKNGLEPSRNPLFNRLGSPYLHAH